MQLPPDLVRKHVEAALLEDLGERGDLTSEAVVPAQRRARGRIFAKAEGVLCGMPLAIESFLQIDPELRIEVLAQDGAHLAPGTEILAVEGSARALLAAERTALNFLQQLSGVATLTARFVEEIRGTGAVVLETRKTVPGLRFLQKYAVRVGGGENHRFGLFDRILLKENHFALSEHGEQPEGYRHAVEKAVAFGGSYGPVCVEVRDLDEAKAAIHGGADVLLLDNLSADVLHETVMTLRAFCRSEGRDVLFEASGGITLETAAHFAAAGVDRLSVGALTHSAPSVDLSMLTSEVPSA
ncbi:MAG: nicotinate-nucleotide diphosphorylase (carboxylating) [Planctomycetota bacterium]|nr:MAG: nicotinate-nucleotide diphosphorylase (carboxylating) [Planctomycetota bacterium]